MNEKTNIKLTNKEKILWAKVTNYLLEKEYALKPIPRSYFIKNYEYKKSQQINSDK